MYVKYHMIYRISIKIYRYTYRIDQTDQYAALTNINIKHNMNNIA